MFRKLWVLRASAVNSGADVEVVMLLWRSLLVEFLLIRMIALPLNEVRGGPLAAGFLGRLRGTVP